MLILKEVISFVVGSVVLPIAVNVIANVISTRFFKN